MKLVSDAVQCADICPSHIGDRRKTFSFRGWLHCRQSGEEVRVGDVDGLKLLFCERGGMSKQTVGDRIWRKEGIVVPGSVCVEDASNCASTAIWSTDSVRMVGGKASLPSAISWKMRFTAITPAAPVRAARSAPTYPGVCLARSGKSKSPARRNLAQSTWKLIRIWH
jgi:hypothetical protein